MDQSEALKEAMKDVTTVADQLRLLQQRIKGFGDASENLKEVSDALIQVSKSIEKIQKPFAELLKKAEEVSKKAEEATKELKAGKNAIDKAGFTASLEALSASQDEMNAKVLDKISEVSASAKSASSDVSALQETMDKITKSINSRNKVVIIFGLAAILTVVCVGYLIGDFHFIEAIFKTG